MSARARCAALAALLMAGPATAQVRGVYPTGMNAVNGGGLPAAGWAYSNLLILNSRDERKDADGNVIATGRQAIALDLNTFTFAGSAEAAGATRYAATATIILSRNSLTSDSGGELGEGAGLGDLFVQPFMIGWSTERTDFKAAYGFVAPTGRFEPQADDNVGAGYWTHALSAGSTIRMGASRRTALSGFLMYEIHGRQEGTGARPGDTVDVDGSLTRAFDGPAGSALLLGVAGYAQWQVSDAKDDDAVDAGRYRVYALGIAAQYVPAGSRGSFALRLYREFDARETFEGVSLQLSGSIAF
ncbi:MAG TPA: transporter [Steroidobacteraceae bacterium]|jgi:hypothetical protein|nr:transporter [Steroidobacteraceae bacterium]